MMFEIIVLLVAGVAAGVVTGFVGASAVVVAAPLLILFLDMRAYVAIGLSLGVDVFASFFASVIYYKNGNLKLKEALFVLVPALVAVLIGSHISNFISSGNLTWISGLAIFGTGVSFLFKKSRKELVEGERRTSVFLQVLAGFIVGLIAGIFGAGGGLMLLAILVLLLGFSVPVAIGTSVLMMVFIALFGAIGHYYYEPFQIWNLVVAGAGGIFGAIVSAKFVNKLDEKILMRVIGLVLILLGGAVFVSEVLM